MTAVLDKNNFSFRAADDPAPRTPGRTTLDGGGAAPNNSAGDAKPPPGSELPETARRAVARALSFETGNGKALGMIRDQLAAAEGAFADRSKVVDELESSNAQLRAQLAALEAQLLRQSQRQAGMHSRGTSRNEDPGQQGGAAHSRSSSAISMNGDGSGGGDAAAVLERREAEELRDLVEQLEEQCELLALDKHRLTSQVTQLQGTVNSLSERLDLGTCWITELQGVVEEFENQASCGGTSCLTPAEQDNFREKYEKVTADLEQAITSRDAAARELEGARGELQALQARAQLQQQLMQAVPPRATPGHPHLQQQHSGGLLEELPENGDAAAPCSAKAIIGLPARSLEPCSSGGISAAPGTHWRRAALLLAGSLFVVCVQSLTRRGGSGGGGGSPRRAGGGGDNSGGKLAAGNRMEGDHHTTWRGRG